MKKYILISDFNLNSNNRGTAALGYGAISFLREKKLMDDSSCIVKFTVHWNPFYKCSEENKIIQGKLTHFKYFHVSKLEYLLFNKFGLSFKFLPFGRMLSNLSCVAAINGGDGFSDIYGTAMFESRNPYSYLAMKAKAPLIILPQTIGPFKEKKNYEEAKRILKYASAIFVRDRQFLRELDNIGVKYELTKDLSSYMLPEPWDIDIKDNSIGINVSGLAYSNNFKELAGQFNSYPALIDRLICHFRDKGINVYIIPHAYGYFDPEENNDDMIACREAYNRLKDKTNVYLIDKDLLSPQIKYVISKMTFFCGTRMHANFAALYTGVPVYGLSYSYKFEGAFEANGQDSKKQLSAINNIKDEEIDEIVRKVDLYYKEALKLN